VPNLVELHPYIRDNTLSTKVKNELTSDNNGHKSDLIRHGHNIRNFLKSFCESSPDITEGIIVITDNGSLVAAAQWPVEQDIDAKITSTLNMAITRQSPVKIVPAISSNAKRQSCIIAVPLIVNQKTIGATALSMDTTDNKLTTERLLELEQKTDTIASLLQKELSTTRPADVNKLLQLQHAFLQKTKLEDALITLVNEMANILKFKRISVGLVKSKQVQLIAISNNTTFIKDHQLAQSITEAMNEAVDQLESVSYPALQADKPCIRLAHQALSKKTDDAVCCIPLLQDGRAIGAISLETQDKASFNQEAILWFEKIANFITPLITLKQKAEQSWFQHAKNACVNLSRQWLDSKNHSVKAVAACFIAIALGLAFIPTTYNIGAQAHIEGATQCVMSAPVKGYIQEAYVKPGDLVKKGDLLITLADQDLLLEKQKWETEITQQENNFSGALARQDRTQYAISQAKAAQAQAELTLINQELARSRIVAPIDGIILEGDLSQSLGAPVKLGDSLMTIAPQGQYRLMIDIDERDINQISHGQTGVLALTAIPTEKIAFTVKRITPVAIVKHGQNTYEVEAEISDTNTYLRPGLQGVAKVNAGEKPVLWRLAHHAIDWIRLSIWKWSY